MTESSLTQLTMTACRAAMPGAEVLKHSDRFNGGYPDVTVTWHGVTSWWEMKFYNNGDFESPALQNAQCRRLYNQGICYYAIYVVDGAYREIRVVPPGLMPEWRTRGMAVVVGGLEHAVLANHIRNKHLEVHSFQR